MNPVDQSRVADTTQNGNVVDLAAYKAQSAEQRKPTSPMTATQRGFRFSAGFVALLIVFFFFLLAIR